MKFKIRYRILNKRIDYWRAYKNGYENYITELGLKCCRVGMWDVYYEHRRRYMLVKSLIRRLEKLKNK